MDYLIDSNGVINYVAENFDSIVLSKLDVVFDTAFNYSVITAMEVLGFSGDPYEMLKFEKLFVAGNSFGIDDTIISKTIHIRKIVKIKLPDAIIAAAAMIHNLQLVTDNINDFSKVPGLKVVHPKDIK